MVSVYFNKSPRQTNLAHFGARYRIEHVAFVSKHPDWDHAGYTHLRVAGLRRKEARI